MHTDVQARLNIRGVNVVSKAGSAEQVGDQDPERGNSPITGEGDDIDYDLHENVSGLSSCLFNDVEYPDGSYVRSGPRLLRCDKGVWVTAGSSDPDNP